MEKRSSRQPNARMSNNESDGLAQKPKNYRTAARKLPEFFDFCFCPEVKEFLLAAHE